MEGILHDESIISRDTINTKYRKIEGSRGVLGSGVNGSVIRLKNIETGEDVAMKQIASNQKSAREVTLHYIAQDACDNITKIDGIFLNRHRGVDYFYVMMECCEGGELFDYIASRDKERKTQNKPSIFTEREVAWMVRQIAQALFHLHINLGIAHRDLKPENLLLTPNFEPLVSGKIKLSDFGFAKEAMNSSKTKALSTACYTPYYVAPEIFGDQRYDFACDIWSLGVILYILLVGYPPFYSMSGQNTLTPGMKSRIQHANYSTATKEFKHVSKDAIELISRMLVVDPKNRITIDEIMRHPWINQDIQQIPETPLELDQHQMDIWSSMDKRRQFNATMTDVLDRERLDADPSIMINPGADVVKKNPLMEKRARKKAAAEEKRRLEAAKIANNGLSSIAEAGDTKNTEDSKRPRVEQQMSTSEN